MRVKKLCEEYDIDVAYRHFPLHPETPDDGLTLEQLFAGRNIDVRAAQDRMKGLMADEGLPYGDRSMTYNSRLAQEVASWADEQPGGDAIHDALFQAYFVKNVNLALEENLVTIATEVGLTADEAACVIRERTHRQSVDNDWRRSRELGITGVPTFVIGQRGIVGAQSYDELAHFVESYGAQKR